MQESKKAIKEGKVIVNWRTAHGAAQRCNSKHVHDVILTKDKIREQKMREDEVIPLQKDRVMFILVMFFWVLASRRRRAAGVQFARRGCEELVNSNGGILGLGLDEEAP